MSRWKASAVNVSLGVPGLSVAGSWAPDDAERAAAWELLVELSTRVAVIELDDEDGTCRESLTSLHQLFDITRGIMHKHGPEVARTSGTGNLSFGVIAIRILNDVLRPVLSEWHVRLGEYEHTRPPEVPEVEWERQWAHHAELRAALHRIRPVIRQYVLVLAEAAQVDELALAVLVPNGGQAPADERPGRGGGREAAAALGFRPRQQMIRWFAPGVLIGSGWRILRLRGRSDPREELSAGDGPTIDLGDEGGELWFDYVADLGDAFDPTMAVAWHLSRPTIHVGEFASGEGLERLPEDGLPRGRFLVMGGDEIYPYPTPGRYRDQTTGPYGLAMADDDAPPILAIPGNHDWYDDLDGFRETFLAHQPIGRSPTVQDATWFSVCLPHGWWVWGIDTALDGTINEAQRDHFARIGRELRPGDRIVLAHPIPAWRLREKRRGSGTDDELGRITELLDEVVPDGVSVPVMLAGDSHLYAHYLQASADADGPEIHHVTSGGGGAFLHPTHNLAPVVPQSHTEPRPYRLSSHWPPRTVSRHALAASTSRVVLDRQSLPLVALLGLLQLAYAALGGGPMRAWLDASPTVGLWDSAQRLFEELRASPVTWATLIGAVLVCALGLARPSVADRLVWKAARRCGLVHGLAQGTVFVVAATLGGLIIQVLGGSSAPTDLEVLVGTVLGAVAGGALAVTVFAHYLRIVNQRYRIHDNEAFSGRHLRGYKHFVRVRIAPDGAMRLFVIGLESVRPGWAVALAERRPPPTTTLTLVDVIDLPSEGS